MALVYAESSALIKRYVAEVGSQWVHQLCLRDTVAVSMITVVEVVSSLVRRQRDRDLSPAEHAEAYARFTRDLDGYQIVDFSSAIARSATDFLVDLPHPLRLRSLDAIHVVSSQGALANARRDGLLTGSLVSADRALLRAAEWAGLPTENPEDHP